MDAYCVEIRKLEGHFEGIEFQHVPWNNNVAADVLSKLGSGPSRCVRPRPVQAFNQAFGSRQSRTTSK
jgi:hypothetical protein